MKLQVVVACVLFLGASTEAKKTSIQLTPGGQAWTLQTPSYPTEGAVSSISFAITSTAGSRITLTCKDIRLRPAVAGACDARVDVRDTKEGKRICKSTSNYSHTSVTNTLIVDLTSGSGSMAVQCTVVARGGTATSAGTSSKPRSPFFSQESREIDSSEFGGPAGKSSTTCACGWTNKPGKKIVGGSFATPNAYPFAVALIDGRTGKQFCGGTILTTYHVLTAAHCTDRYVKTKQRLVVYAGAHQVNTYTAVRQQLEVHSIIQHSSYDANKIMQDIALLVLAKPISFNLYVGPACISPVRMNLDKRYVKIIGWGRISHTGPASPTLKKVNLRVVPMASCARMFPGYLTANSWTQMCTHGSQKGSCMGDSGGPVVWLDPTTNRYTLVGLVSYGKICAEHPSVHTDVSAYYNWIVQSIRSSYSPNSVMCSKR